MQSIQQIKQFTDREIVERVLEGEIALFEILIRRHNPFLYKTGRAYGYGHHDVEDLMQEAFINAYINLSKFEFRSSFKTWVIRIMLNQCHRKKLKSGFKNEICAEIIIHEKSVPMFSNSPDSLDKSLVNKELSHIIEKAIEEIPIDYRMVFSLREINGLSVAETAHILELTENNVKVRLNRAKNMLRKKIEKMYSPEDIFEFNLIYCDKIVNRVMEKIKNL